MVEMKKQRCGKRAARAVESKKLVHGEEREDVEEGKRQLGCADRRRLGLFLSSPALEII